MTTVRGCGSPEHAMSRRALLGAAGASMFPGAALANPLVRQNKRVLMIFLAGGVSQLETWDPKPGAPTGGPFRAIPTSVPGTHVCELLPHTARQMHRLALVRGINTAEDDHGKGSYIMHTGRRQEPSLNYPIWVPWSRRWSPTRKIPCPDTFMSSRGAAVVQAPRTRHFLGPASVP